MPKQPMATHPRPGWWREGAGAHRAELQRQLAAATSVYPTSAADLERIPEGILYPSEEPAQRLVYLLCLEKALRDEHNRVGRQCRSGALPVREFEGYQSATGWYGKRYAIVREQLHSYRQILQEHPVITISLRDLIEAACPGLWGDLTSQY